MLVRFEDLLWLSIRQTHLLNKQYVPLDLQEESASEPYVSKSESGEDADVRAASKKNYELCVGAANHIASIGLSLPLCRRFW